MPKKIASYELQQVIGRGAYGTVYKARNVVTNQPFAIKRIRKNMISGEGMLAALKSEIMNMLACDHPSIAWLRQAFFSRQSLYLVMQLVKGDDFIEFLNRKGPLQEAEARRYFDQLCSAIHYLKDRRIAHRDIKLENILVDDQDNLKLVDFGLSVFLKNPSQIFQEEMTTQCGTLQYLAPQIVQKKPYDPYASDVWALGVVLYCFVAGNTPFHSDHMTTLLKNIINGRVEYDFSCSQPLKQLLNWIFHINPLKRPTVQQIREHRWMQSSYPLDVSRVKFTAISTNSYFEEGLHCRIISGIELSLALFKLALVKSMRVGQKNRNTLLLRGKKLQTIDKVLKGMGFTVDQKDVSYKAAKEGCGLEILKVQAIDGLFIVYSQECLQAVKEKLQNS